MDFKSILSELKGGTYRPVYFLQGEEPYYIDRITHFIEQNAIAETERDFNQTILYGKDTNIAEVLNHAKRYPMMAERQVVIVKEAQHLKKELDQISGYLKQPLETTVLVFNFKYDKLDGRKEVSKLFKKQLVFTSDKLKEYRVPDWITGYLQSKGYRIASNASGLLSEFLGNDLSKISGELDKLAILVPKETEITPDIIQQNIGISKDFNVFELQNALLKRDVFRANLIVQHFSKNQKNHPAPLVIGQLFALFSKLMKLHFVKNKSNDQEVARTIGVHPFFVKDYKAALGHYNPRKLAHIIGLLRTADLQSKGIGTTNIKEEQLYKQLIFEILH